MWDVMTMGLSRIRVGPVVAAGVGLAATAALAVVALTKDDEAGKTRKTDEPRTSPKPGDRPSTPSRARPEIQPEQAARQLFGKYDKNHQGGITASEAVRRLNTGNVFGPSHYVRREGDSVVYKHRVGYERTTRSIRPTVRSADNASFGNGDRKASWTELRKLVARADADGSGGLSPTEMQRLRAARGEKLVSRVNVWTGYTSFRIHDPRETPSRGRAPSHQPPARHDRPDTSRRNDRDPARMPWRPRPQTSYPSTPPNRDTARGDDPVYVPPPPRPTPPPPLPPPRPTPRPTPPPPSRPPVNSTNNGNPDKSKF